MKRSFLLNFQIPCQESELTTLSLPQTGTEIIGTQQSGLVVSNAVSTTMTQTFVKREGAESENNIFQTGTVIPQSSKNTQTQQEKTDTAHMHSSKAYGTFTKTAVAIEQDDEDVHLFSLRAIPLCY